MKTYIFHKVISDDKSMRALGATLARACPDTAVIFLQGELGAGKTTLVRGFIQELGYKDKVKSPTYTIVEPYELAHGYLYHFDLYRINDAEELEFMGVQDYFTTKSICLIEWPERATDFLPTPDLSCVIKIIENHREVNIESKTVLGKTIIESIVHEK